MKKTSFSMEERQLQAIDEFQEEIDADSRAEALRELVDEFDELRDRVDDLQDDLERERARADDLRRQLQQATSKNEDVDELATYVREERRFEQRWREASIVQRARWRIFGMPSPDDRDSG